MVLVLLKPVTNNGVQKLTKLKQSLAKITSTVILLTSIITLGGCTTVPVLYEIDYMSLLSADNDIFLSLNVQKNKGTLTSMLKKLSPEMKDTDINKIFERTSNLYLGIKFDSEKREQAVEICAVGSYPSIIASGLTRNKGWTKEMVVLTNASGKALKQKKYSHDSGISLALPNPSLLLLSTSSVETLLQSLVCPYPSDWPQYALNAVSNKDNDEKIRAYIPNPGILLPKILGLGVQLALEDATAVCTEIYVPGKTSQLLTDMDLYFKDSRAVKAASALLKLAALGSNMTIEQKGDNHLSIQGLLIPVDVLIGMKF